MSKVEMLGTSPIASDRQARPLSPATRAGDFVFVSGQVPTDDQGQAERPRVGEQDPPGRRGRGRRRMVMALMVNTGKRSTLL